MKNNLRAVSLACTMLAVSACATAPKPPKTASNQPEDVAIYIKREVTDMVRNTDFPKQQATISDIISRFPNNWYTMIAGQPVLETHNVGGVVINDCRAGLNAALDQKNVAKVANAADECLNGVDKLFADTGMNPPQEKMQRARDRA